MSNFSKRIAVGIPEHLLKPLTDNTTSLLDNPSIPAIEGNSLLLNLVAEKIHGFGNVTDEEITTMRNQLAQHVTECMKIERENKSALEKLCVDLVRENLEIPDDMIAFNAELTEKIDTTERQMLPETEHDFSYENLDDMERMGNDIAKRRLLDALSMGAAVRMSSDINGYMKEVFAINHDLPKLYSKILELNNTLLYIDNSVSDDKGHTDSGIVTVTLTNSENEISIASKGIIFPMLLSETFKGVFEVVASHGLPNNTERAKYIIEHSDFQSADIWDMRLGTLLWERIMDMITDKDVNPAYLFYTLSQIDTDSFSHTMKEIFAGTKSGKRTLDEMCDDINDGLEYDEFEDHITNMSSQYCLGDAELDDTQFDINETEDLFSENARHSNRILITEADQGIDKTRKIIQQVFGGMPDLDLDGVVTDPAYYVGNNPQTTWRQYILFNLRHTFGLMENNASKYLPTVARLAYSDAVRFDIADDNGSEVRTLQRIVNELKQDQKLFQKVRTELNQAGVNPSDVFNELRDAFADKFRQADEKDAAEANSVEGDGSDYTVVEVPDFKTAKYYGYHSCSESKLCYTQSESTWNTYTANGTNAVYVCLRDGWERIPEVPTKGNPYDLYGTSMIFVFVSPKGEITCSNCRWNHKVNGKYENGVDHAFTKASLSKTIGMPFDSVFKPKEVDMQRITEMIEKGGGRLSDIVAGDFAIPDGIRKIGNEAFYNCSALTSVTIPNSVTSISGHAFSVCRRLTSVTIPNSVTSIGEYAFAGCAGLTSVIIPDSVKLISDSTFEGCESLTSVTIPDSVTSIGYQAFAGCSGLTSVTIPNSVKEIGNCAFYGCSGLTSINIPNSVTKISSYAFFYCSGLTRITIPNTVTSISGHAFQYCDALTSVVIPDSVKEIGDCAFDGCTGLTSVTIPDSVTSIGGDPFFRCNNLTIYVSDEEHVEMVRGSGFVGKIVVKGRQQNENRKRRAKA